MKNRFTRLLWGGLPVFLLLLLTVPSSAQTCDNSNPYFTFNYSGPDTIPVGITCLDTLDWPTGTATVQCMPGFTCDVGFFDFSPALTGYPRGAEIGEGNTITVYYVLEATIIPGMIFVRDTFCFDIAFVDGIAPIFTIPPPPNDTFNCRYAVPAPTFLPADDICDTSFPKNIAPVDNGTATLCNGGIINRTWTAVDSSGNSRSVIQKITVLPDNIPPVIVTRPISLSEPCETANYIAWLTAQRAAFAAGVTDNCGILSTADNAPTDFRDTCGTLTISFAVSDSCGLVTTTTANYSITDGTPPIISGVGIADTIRLTCGTPFPSIPTVSYSDNCTARINLDTVFTIQSSQTNDGSCTDYSYTTIRTWRATDKCGNGATHHQVIIVKDDQAPNFVVPPTANVNCGSSTVPAVTGMPTGVTDNCDSAPIVTFRDAIDTLGCPNNLRITREWRATDACGNIAIRLQTINVSDNLAPTFTRPRDTMVLCQFSGDPNMTGRPTNVQDNCDTTPRVSFTDVTTGGACINSFQISRIWTVRDTCGNQNAQTQVITVVDSLKPVFTTLATDLTIECAGNPNANVRFNSWISNHGGAVASDNCTSLANLSWQALNSGTSNPASLPALNCPSPILGILRQQTVDFVVADQCGNRDTVTATFTISDQTPPEITECQRDTVVGTSPGICAANIDLRLPVIEEECNRVISNISQLKLEPVTSNGPLGDPDIVVNNIVYDFLVPGPPAIVKSDLTLRLSLYNIDAEAPTEFFILRAEDGSIIGQSNTSATQCDSSITTFTITNRALVSTWAIDGTLRFTIESNRPPSLPGRFGINNICANATAMLSINYDYEVTDNVLMQYSLNGGPRQTVTNFSVFVPLNLTLPEGVNDLKYYITDCGGNQDSCAFSVTVIDIEPPVLVCPLDINVGLDPGQCTASVTLPVPRGATDNCGLPNDYTQTQPADDGSRNMTFYRDPNLGDFLAEDRTVTFTGTNTNAFGTGGTVTVFLKGDVESGGEFFTVIGENNTVLGTTEVGQLHVTPGNCNTVGRAVFNVPATTLNAWAADGNVTIQLISNVNIPVPPGGPGSGINPCRSGVVTMNGQIDSVSQAWVNLTFNSVTPTYFTTGATTIPPTVMIPSVVPTHTFNAGTTTVFYTIEDIHGLRDTCSYRLNVADTEPPVADCTPSVVRINPAGSIRDTISPTDINAQSSDNCGIDTMYVVPNIFTCNQIDDTVSVILVVVDLYGNRDTCHTFVRIEGEEPRPTFNYTCGVDSLYLFANPPAAPGNIVYTYRWYGPLGNLISTQRNPVITDFATFVAGNYCVEIEGLTGCTTIGCVNIPIDIRPPQPVLAAPAKVCWDTDDIQLSTIPPPGVSGIIEYHWYSGVFPAGTLAGTSSTPNFTVAAPHNVAANSSTSACFYVIIAVNGCVSQPSNGICVNIVRPPTPSVVNPVISLCEGLPLQLGTPNAGSDITYQWRHVTVQVDPVQNPMVTDSTNAALHAGNYYLTIFKDGCPSEEVQVIVNVLDKPDGRPNIFPTTISVCEGEEVTLRTNIVGVASYIWEGPVIPRQTSINSLTFNARPLDAGNWRVRVVTNDNCFSDLSDAAVVNVNTFNAQVIAAANPNPVCVGESVRLEVQPSLSNASYVWMNPNNVVISATQFAQVNNIQLNEAGNYKVMVTNEFGCMREAVVNVSVSAGVEVVAISNDAPNCFIGPTDVKLSLIVFPPDDGSYQYRWTGPCNFISPDSQAVVQDVTAACNGAYSVIVTSGDGCKSAPRSTSINGLGPFATPAISKTPDKVAYCEGESLTITTTGYTGRNITYTWTTPMGQQVTNTPTLVLDSLTVAINNGRYSVVASVDGCATLSSGDVFIRVNPIPVAMPEAEIPCEGGVLRLIGNFSPNTGTPSFQWLTPRGNFGVKDPVISPADPTTDNGTYTFIVTMAGCISMPASLNILIKEGPPRATPEPVDPFCLWGGDPLVLCVNPATATPGATYEWTNQAGIVIGTTNQRCLAVSDLAGYTEGIYPFFLAVIQDGCKTRNPSPVVVQMSTIPPNRANAGADFSVCEKDLVMLNAMPTAAGDEGNWRYLGTIPGIEITTPSENITSVTGLPAGGSYRFEWCLSHGGCVDYDCDTVRVKIFEVEDANAGPESIDTCLVSSLRLRAVPSLSGTGRWTQERVQDQLGVVIVDPTDPRTLVRFPNPGTYVFTWIIPDSVCGGDRDIVIVNISGSNPDAGDSFDDCGNGQTQLLANVNQSGRWSSPDSNISFVDVNDPLTRALGLKDGINIFVWTIDDGICGDDSRDTVRVNYTIAPFANDDEVEVSFGGTRTIDLIANDQNAIDGNIKILLEPQHGVLTRVANGSYQFIANLNYIGPDLVIYQLCSTDPNCECSNATVRLTIGGEIEDCMEIPSIITPNGDDKNEAFSIPCLSQIGKYPSNELIIFNQWGDEVFRQKPYGNGWAGTFDGEELPDGTYFYVLDLGNGDKPLSGFLIVQR